jgi:hydroxymethylpyrimidine pyrophosphatase-like HAD family hydrolase
MRYLALAVDYDGTIAHADKLSPVAAAALERLRGSGRRAILVTGRRLDDLLDVCPEIRLFDLVVAENGGVVYDPKTREQTVLASPPSKRLLRGLRGRGVPLEVGQVVVATAEPHRRATQDVVWQLGLEAQVIGNRSAVMVLPAGVNKASGLEHALRKLGLSRHEVLGIGDAENDHSFLERCECAVAVANATSSVKEAVAFVTKAANGAGVAEVIDELIATDLSRMEGTLEKHLILLGRGRDDTAIEVAPYGCNLLIAGPSGSGKSTITAGILERLMEKDYQVCIVDPEGDYGTLPDVVTLGNQWRAPSVSEVLAILDDPKINLNVNLLGIALEERPAFFAQLIPNLQALRSRVGRPHWLVLDEAHHLLPATWGHASSALPHELGETILVTVHPDHVAPAILSTIKIAIAIGEEPETTLRKFADATDRVLEWPEGLAYQAGHVITWFAGEATRPVAMQPQRGRAERIRHHRKYVEGNLRWHSFYFRGPHGRLNLRAQNLTVFCQIAEGVDEETWVYHLRRGDYSRWFRHCVKDEWLADEMARIEHRTDLEPTQARQVMVNLIFARYTLSE